MTEFRLFQENIRLKGEPFLVFAKRETPNRVILQFRIGDKIIGEAKIDLAKGIVKGVNNEKFEQLRLVNVCKFLPLPSTEKILIIYTCMGSGIGAEVIDVPGVSGVYYFETCEVFYA